MTQICKVSMILNTKPLVHVYMYLMQQDVQMQQHVARRVPKRIATFLIVQFVSARLTKVSITTQHQYDACRAVP